MGIVKRTKERTADTFQARNLHELREKPDIGSFIEYRAQTGYSLGTAQRRRKGRIEL